VWQDAICGSAHADELHGGGADTFVFLANEEGQDTIGDFITEAGAERDSIRIEYDADFDWGGADPALHLSRPGWHSCPPACALMYPGPGRRGRHGRINASCIRRLSGP